MFVMFLISSACLYNAICVNTIQIKISVVYATETIVMKKL